MYMQKFVDGGPAQQVTQFQPTFSTAPQGIGSIQQAPNTPAMESSPIDYNQSPQYAPTQQYGAPAANPMTAGLGSYLQGLEYKALPVAAASNTSTPVYDSTAPYIYDPATQTYQPNPLYVAPSPVASSGTGDTESDGGGGYGDDGGGYGGDYGDYGGDYGDFGGDYGDYGGWGDDGGTMKLEMEGGMMVNL
jgi:hypothetical protein